MDGRYFLDFKEDLSVFDNNEKGIYFVTEVAPQPEEDTIEGIVIDVISQMQKYIKIKIMIIFLMIQSY